MRVFQYYECIKSLIKNMPKMLVATDILFLVNVLKRTRIYDVQILEFLFREIRYNSFYLVLEIDEIYLFLASISYHRSKDHPLVASTV